jgi:hypothetical protein
VAKCFRLVVQDLLHLSLNQQVEKKDVMSIRPVPPAVAAALETSIKVFVPDIESAGEAMPVFVFDRASPLTVEDLGEFGKQNAKPHAWRFILRDHGEPVATCDVTMIDNTEWPSETPKYELTQVSDGADRAKELLKVVSRAKASVESEGDHDVALIDAPAFHLGAVWLHSEERRELPAHDHFQVYRARRAELRNRLVSADEFVRMVNEAQARKMRGRAIA